MYLCPQGCLGNSFYIDSGPSDHLVPAKGGSRTYQEFATLAEIAAADSGEIYAYSNGALRMATSVMVRSGSRTWKTSTTHLGFTCNLCCSGNCKHRDGTLAYLTAEWNDGAAMGFVR